MGVPEVQTGMLGEERHEDLAVGFTVRYDLPHGISYRCQGACVGSRGRCDDGRCSHGATSGVVAWSQAGCDAGVVAQYRCDVGSDCAVG